MIHLLDGNVLTALTVDSHLHHSRVSSWFATAKPGFATCSVTQGTLLRLYMQIAADRRAETAWAVLAMIESHPLHVFWDDGFGYRHVSAVHIQGHRQVTDSWLAELARRHQGKLVTLDHGLVAAHGDVAILVPV